MKKGINVCEREGCGNDAKADFQRKGVELKGWPEKMPIALCASHCKGHIPVICDLQMNNDGELVFNLMAYPGYTLGRVNTKTVHVIRRYKRRKRSLSEIAKECGINYKLFWQRLKRGSSLKEAKGEKISLKKPVVMLTKELTLVKEFDSIADASRETGINSKHISRVLTGTRRKSTGGYIFKYKAA